MNNRVVITKYKEQYLIIFLKDDIAVKIHAINAVDEMSQTIFLGRVESVKKNIDSCFVRYSEYTGFLKKKDIKPEAVLPIMLKKETPEGKENEITDKISLSGIYVVISEHYEGVKYSSRLNIADKEKFKNLNIDNVIIRNNAKNIDIDSIVNEYHYLNEQLSSINTIKNTRTCNSVLYKGIPKIIDVIVSEDLSEFNEILTDSNEVYELIKYFIEDYKEKSINIPIHVKLYEDDMVSLAAMMSLSSKIDRAINRKVYLKSDAYIVFDYTEAMTVIDINSGTTVLKGDKSSVIHKINMEAAEEIARQLKLRNLSGIIIVDFINEYKKEYKEELLSNLKSLLKLDDCHAMCHDMTKLGLIEITRNRKYRPLREQLWK